VTLPRRAFLASVASVVWLLAATASAQGPHRSQQGREGNGRGPQRMVAPDQRPMGSHDGLAPGGGRLSPEERRQLRRDVQEAGRDIYSDRMPPGRREARRQ
jgi:hypothetical protein